MPYRWARLLGVVFFTLSLLVAIRISGLQNHIDLHYLHDLFIANQFRGICIFIALFVLGNLAHLPGWIFLAAAVLALGPVVGASLTYVSALASCSVTFVLIRHIGGDALRGVGGRLGAWALAQLDSHPVRSVTLLRMGLQTLPTLSYVLALSGLRFRQHWWGTVLGLPLPILAYTLLVRWAANWLHLPQF